MTVLNRTVFDIPLTWNRSRFESTRNQCRIARKLIETSINGKFEYFDLPSQNLLHLL